MMLLVLVIACIVNVGMAVVVEIATLPPEQYMALINAAVAGYLIAAIHLSLRDGR